VRYFGDSGQLDNQPEGVATYEIWWIDDQYNAARQAYNIAGNSAWWWLRSPGTGNHSVAFIRENGYINIGGFNVFDGYDGGLRPAVWCDLQTQGESAASAQTPTSPPTVPDTDTYGNGDYALTKYILTIAVNEDNTLHINEQISAHFNIPRHGIMRRIPLNNSIVRADGSTASNQAQVSDLSVRGDQYTDYIESGDMVIRIGNPDVEIIGSKDYDISYIYDIGRDMGEGYDEFYYNIIGDGWDTTISDISFTITMPKDIAPEKVGFSHGQPGLTKSDRVRYVVDGSQISGAYDGVLQAGEGLTVRVELPEGYFVRE
jgi:hypothetical protein